MRWIKHRKKDNKYRIWSTFTDEWITDWLTREEAVEWFEKVMRRETNSKIKQMRLTFPQGFGRKDKPYHIFQKPL